MIFEAAVMCIFFYCCWSVSDGTLNWCWENQMNFLMTLKQARFINSGMFIFFGATTFITSALLDLRILY
jgi:hypothetical protein